MFKDVSSLWEKCQVCWGGGTVPWIHTYLTPEGSLSEATCPSCLGARVRPTGEAIEVFLREAGAYVAMHGGNIGGAATSAGLMGLWNLIDKELVG